MEKWAQSVNKKKETVTKKPTAVSTASSGANKTSEGFALFSSASRLVDSEPASGKAESSWSSCESSSKKVYQTQKKSALSILVPQVFWPCHILLLRHHRHILTIISIIWTRKPSSSRPRRRCRRRCRRPRHSTHRVRHRCRNDVRPGLNRPPCRRSLTRPSSPVYCASASSTLWTFSTSMWPSPIYTK